MSTLVNVHLGDCLPWRMSTLAIVCLGKCLPWQISASPFLLRLWTFGIVHAYKIVATSAEKLNFFNSLLRQFYSERYCDPTIARTTVSKGKKLQYNQPPLTKNLCLAATWAKANHRYLLRWRIIDMGSLTTLHDGPKKLVCMCLASPSSLV